MVCRNCGCEVGETEQFCPKCGFRLKGSQPENQEEIRKEKEGKKPHLKWFLLITMGAAAVISFAAAAMSGPELSNLFRRVFYSPEKYYACVEEQACMETVGRLTAFYENWIERDRGNFGTHEEMEIKLEKETVDFLEEWTGYPDLSWCKSVTVTGDFFRRDNLCRGNGVIAAGKPVLSVETVLNTESGRAYFALPELSSSYVGIKNWKENSFTGNVLAEGYEKIPAIVSLYSDKEKTDEVLRNYIRLILANVDEVKKGTDVLEAEGIAQKCTVLEVRLDREDLHAMAEAVRQKAAGDQETEEFFMGFAMAMEELPDMDMRVWVDNRGRIRGREVTVEGKKIFSYAMPMKKEEYGYRMKAGPDQEFSIEGTGVYTQKELKGEFEICGKGQRMKLRINEFDVEKYAEGWLDGVFEVQASGCGLSMDLTQEREKTEIFMTAYLGSKALGTGRMLWAPQEVTEMQEPENENVVWIEEESDLEEWLETVDVKGFISHLKQTDIPEEVIDNWEAYIGYYYF